jgi:hypothetical protein
MIAADRAKIPQSAATFVRGCDESIMPTSPESMQRTPGYLIQAALLNEHKVKTLMPQYANRGNSEKFSYEEIDLDQI